MGKSSSKIPDIIKYYAEHIPELKKLQEPIYKEIINNEDLQPHIHSVRTRIKSKKSLSDKIKRKRKEKRVIDTGNLFEEITDVIGFRILHLFTRQIIEINKALIKKFQFMELEAEPEAYFNDAKQLQYYEKLGAEVKTKKSEYSSVHYKFKTKGSPIYRCEIQVRTIYEEAWSEVDHKYRYPQIELGIGEKTVLSYLNRFCTISGLLANDLQKISEDSKLNKKNLSERDRQIEKLKETMDMLKKEVEKSKASKKASDLVQQLSDITSDLPSYTASSISAIRPDLSSYAVEILPRCYICKEEGKNYETGAFFLIENCSVCKRDFCFYHKSHTASVLIEDVKCVRCAVNR